MICPGSRSRFHNARHAVHVVLELERCDPELHDIKEEQWVDVALEGLAQYLPVAWLCRDAHPSACCPESLARGMVQAGGWEAKVHTLPLRKLPPRD